MICTLSNMEENEMDQIKDPPKPLTPEQGSQQRQEVQDLVLKANRHRLSPRAAFMLPVSSIRALRHRKW